LAKPIEVFVRSQKKLTGENILVQVDPGHPCTMEHGYGTAHTITCKTEHVLPDEDRRVLDIAMVVAEEERLKIKVHDLSKFGGKLKANFKGVQKTPTIILGDKRIDGSITKESILTLFR